MRRGLMGRNDAELPVAAIEARLARLRAEMDAAGMDAFVVYTNNVRPSAVTYLTGFTPYWSDALLLIQQTGAPVFATALSKRVSEWIRTTDPVSEIVNTPKPGALIGERLKSDSLIRRVGVLEYDTLPAGLADDLAAAAPAVELIDGSGLFEGQRRSIDQTERALLARADAIAVAALREAESGKASDAGTLAGLIEQHARLNGAEEAYIAVAPDLDADRRLKDGSAAKADAWFEGVVQSIEPNKPLAAQLTEKLKALPGSTLDSWMAESCVGSYPLSVVGPSAASAIVNPLNGQFLVLTSELTIDGAPWIGAAPLIVGQKNL
jgi:hypothetical protein